MNEIREAIRQFILATYLPGESAENLGDRTPLVTSGLLDSLAVLELTSFIQKRFGVELDVYDTSAERFNTIEEIAGGIVRKQGQVPSHPGGGGAS